MRKSTVFAICFLALVPAVQSQAEVVVSSRTDYSTDALLVYTGAGESGKQEIAVRGDLSVRDLKQMMEKFSEQSRKFSDLERSVDELKRENDSLKSSNEALSRKMDDMQRTISDLSSKIK